MMPRIRNVEFGNIKIDDETFGKEDFILFNDGFERVEKSHQPSLEEFQSILLREPELVIFGTGFSGCVKINNMIKKEAENNKIEIVILPTPDALKKFQELSKAGKRVAARIHTTC